MAPDVADMAAQHTTRVSLTVAGETCLIVQLIPQSFIMRMSAALAGSDSLGYDEDALTGPTLDSAWVHGTSLRLDAELGGARLTADEVLGLRSGAVVVLDRAVDDPIELFVNGTPYGLGRLLLDEGEWAVIIEELATPQADQDKAEFTEDAEATAVVVEDGPPDKTEDDDGNEGSS
jgi:flagellar motor switch protein FliN/FliY